MEYRASRLIELVREKGRWLHDRVSAYLNSRRKAAPRRILRSNCITAHGFAATRWRFGALWSRLRHVARQQGARTHGHQRTDHPAEEFRRVLQDIDAIATVTTAIREDDISEPLGYKIDDPAWDNNNRRTIQVPKSQAPTANQNTVELNNYELGFRRGWYLDARKTDPVRYLNGMVDYTNPNNPDKSANNIIEMRWLLQQELGSALVYFHEVTIPPGCIEGTHRHIGSEELYFIYEGEGVAHMGEGDDPASPLAPRSAETGRCLWPRETAGPRSAGEAGTIIYTKSGGIHGIRNPGTTPLRFVAFGYHTV